VRDKLVGARMNALWFTYMSVLLFSFLPDYGIILGFFEIMFASATLTVLLNAWNWYKDDSIFDERKKVVATRGMAWAFVVVTLLTIPIGATEVDISKELVRNTVSMGIWTWIIYFSISNIYHKYGDDLL
jgi:hypothetical protein